MLELESLSEDPAARLGATGAVVDALELGDRVLEDLDEEREVDVERDVLVSTEVT